MKAFEARALTKAVSENYKALALPLMPVIHDSIKCAATKGKGFLVHKFPRSEVGTYTEVAALLKQDGYRVLLTSKSYLPHALTISWQ